jgi:hypothetical protein
MRRRGLTYPAVFAIPLLAFTAACSSGGGAGNSEPSTSPAATGGPTTSASPTAAPDIRQQDFSKQPAMQDFLNSAGGEIDPTAITYGDLTGDGVEEAVVPVSSGGQGGSIAIFVFGYGQGGLTALLRLLPQAKSIQAQIENGQLVTIEPEFGASDPLCCPSELRKSTYGWNGTDLVRTNAETVPATPSGAGG